MLRVTKLIVYQIYKKIKLIRKHLQRISFSGLGKKKLEKIKKWQWFSANQNNNFTNAYWLSFNIL